MALFPTRIQIIVGLLLFLLLVPSMSAAAEKAPRFWIKNLNGERFDTKRHKGPILVSFFFVGCVPCIKEIPMLRTFVETKIPHVALLYVDPIKEDTQADVEEFAKQLNVPAKYFYRDPLSRLMRKFFKEQIGFPTIVGVKNKMKVFRLDGIHADTLVMIEETLGE